MPKSLENWFDDLFGDVEPLTEKLIAELVAADKWDEKDLREWQKLGYVYNRKRGSILSMPEFGG